MPPMKSAIVTGAFSYSGKYITQGLLDQGVQVKTLTGHPDRPNPFSTPISVAPLQFKDQAALIKELQGYEVLINTYWIRFNHKQLTFAEAVENTKRLFEAAKEAGVKRIIHVSITNPSLDSNLPYFQGKAVLEEFIHSLGISYGIIRPTIIFGKEDVLINNISWVLRRFPVFAIPGKGAYKVQPIFVEDLAQIIIQAAESDQNIVWDAVGPELFTFKELLKQIQTVIQKKSLILSFPPMLAWFLSSFIGIVVRDVILTKDEVRGLMGNLLISEAPPRGKKRLTQWMEEHKEQLGIQYASELNRHYKTIE